MASYSSMRERERERVRREEEWEDIVRLTQP